MLMVRHIISGLTHKGIQFLDEEINDWLKNNEVAVKDIKELYVRAPTGMSGTIEDAIIISLWYESKQMKEA